MASTWEWELPKILALLIGRYSCQGRVGFSALWLLPLRLVSLCQRARGSPPSPKPPGFWLKPPSPQAPNFFGWTSCFGTIVREPDGVGAEPCRVFVGKRLQGNLEGV